jgi:hypothetical protein
VAIRPRVEKKGWCFVGLGGLIGQQEQRDLRMADTFNQWTNYLKSQDADPLIGIATGRVGSKRSEPELVLCMPENLDIDWMIEALEATLLVVKQMKSGATKVIKV